MVKKLPPPDPKQRSMTSFFKASPAKSGTAASAKNGASAKSGAAKNGGAKENVSNAKPSAKNGISVKKPSSSKKAKAASSSTTGAKAAAPPKFPWQGAKVLKKKIKDGCCFVEEKEEDDDDDSKEEYYTPPVFMTGTVVSALQDKKMYTVEFVDDEDGNEKKTTSSQWSEAQVKEGISFYKAVGTKIAKEFDDGLYEGQVKDIIISEKTTSYMVLYEDEDFEEFSESELQAGVKKYAASKNKRKSAKKDGRDKTKRARVSYKEDSDDDDDMEVDNDDDDDFDPDAAAANEADDAKDDDEDMALVDSDDDFEDSKPAAKRAKKAKAKSTKKSKATKTKKAATGKKTKKPKPTTKEEIMAAFHEGVEKQKEGYTPNNNPQTLPDCGDYVEAVGVDPTFGIIEGIVGAQVKKVGMLLQKVKTANHQAGELTYPIDLQTACSGTDAPSIALDLIKQNLDKMNPDNKFEYEHHMSCEIASFKQGYIARNFPGTTLFPDITKLSETDEEGKPMPVADVYGRLKSIPDGNLFIAGTSCKDFSMLKTSLRKDIEDAGQSGETFLAAVEFLEVHQPPFAIFENVQNAPWGKMQNYITGHLPLNMRNDQKNISTKKSKARKDNADDDLVFIVNKEGRYEAFEIPPQVGMKAGTVVKGILRNSKTMTADKKDIGKKFTLRQLAKRHGIDLDKGTQDTLVMEKKARYCTRVMKVDTKDFGLPQTRNRKYMFVWRCDNPDDDLGDYFEEIIEYMKTPLLHSIEAFLLPVTHDRMRCMREALRTGPGQLMARDRTKESDFFDPMSQVKDTYLHYAFRAKNGLPLEQRWLTEWGMRGQKQLAPGLWPELFDCWNMRRLDMIDCFAGACFRDAIARDANHHLFQWDISQNVTRAPYRSATVGVAGCCTPGMETVLPHLGRSLMGYEKLLLQGIPFSRLTLGRETEVQLSDLAGNAMSLPVISAMILAAVTSPQLKKERKRNPFATMKSFNLITGHEDTNGKVVAERGDLHEQKDATSAEEDFEEALRPVLAIAEEAYHTSVLCTCESSGMMSNEKILQCKGCGWRCCHSCTDRYQTESHDLVDLDVGTDSNQRPDSHAFERRLRSAAPSLLRLGKGAEDLLREGDGLESYTFQMQQVERMNGYWQLVYGAYEDNGSGRQVAEIRVNVGRLSSLDSNVGLAAFVRSFAPAIRHVKPHQGKLEDSSRLFMKADGTSSGWEVPCTPKKDDSFKLSLIGSDPVDSQRATIGLDDIAASDLKDKVITSRFQLPIQSRNPLTHYPSKWREWPGLIRVSGDPSNRANGTYRKLDCKHTVVLSALWRREENGSGPMYLFYRPNVMRSGLDVAVFSPSPSYVDGMEVVELHDWIPENTFSERFQTTSAKMLRWEASPSLNIRAPSPTATCMQLTKSFQERLTSTDTGATVVQITNLSQPVIRSLLEYGNEMNGYMALALFGKTGTQCSKRLSIVAAPSLLKFAAEGKLSLVLSQWHSLAVEHDLGKCQIHVPSRPQEKWQERQDGTFERVYDPKESDDYYLALMNRPEAWEVAVDEKEGSLIVRCQPHVAAHRARALLSGDSNDGITVDYQVAEFSAMAEPTTRPFRVPNSDKYGPTTFTENNGLLLPLYPRQAKALTRMIEIENGTVAFDEEERSEHSLPGIGWCLIAKAQRKKPLAGGVLGDAIGSGKTVITIALILKQVENARANCDPKKGRSGATLIVVPPGLVRQWQDEIKKFAGNKLKSIIITDTKCLTLCSVSQLCKADIVIVPAGLIAEKKGTTSRPYTDNLRKKAKSESPIPPAPSTCSQKEANTAEGVWIRNQASGAEFYVGNKGNQRYRDKLAHYSHCYSEAVAKLRQKTFGPGDKGVPLEYFKWERIIIDECHETLVTGKDAIKLADYKDDAKRGAREFLGVAQTDAKKRPLLAATGVWGLSGTPLLETEARVTELANLCGNTYVTGQAHHWRKDEAYSGRDIFLNQTEGTLSREYRKAVSDAAHNYVNAACQRNRGEQLEVSLTREQVNVEMSEKEGDAFMKFIAPAGFQTYDVSPDQLGDHTSNVVSLTASSPARHKALIDTINSILYGENGDPTTKIIVFATSLGYDSACKALDSSETSFCKVSESDSVERQNEVISWFRHVDANDTERARPRVLLLNFAQAAGHNLQEACHSVVIFDPYYTGSDAVGDASVEEQAIGRVMRQGQKHDVSLTRIVLRGPQGQKSVDDRVVERNTDPDVIAAACSNFE